MNNFFFPEFFAVHFFFFIQWDDAIATAKMQKKICFCIFLRVHWFFANSIPKYEEEKSTFFLVRCMYVHRCMYASYIHYVSRWFDLYHKWKLYLRYPWFFFNTDCESSFFLSILFWQQQNCWIFWVKVFIYSSPSPTVQKQFFFLFSLLKLGNWKGNLKYRFFFCCCWIFIQLLNFLCIFQGRTVLNVLTHTHTHIHIRVHHWIEKNYVHAIWREQKKFREKR